MRLKRIDKRVAREMFYDGQDIILAPSKVIPGRYWVELGRFNAEHTTDDFETVVADYAKYHCCRETGYTVTIYREVK